MSKLCVSETKVPTSADQLKGYWRYLGGSRFSDFQLAFFSNGYFRVAQSSWRAVAIYDNLSQLFIDRLKIAELPYLTFHVFGNGYMAAANDNGNVDIYAPNGKLFARHARSVKWWGELSAYVYVDGNEYYLADVTDSKEPVLLGSTAEILNVEQNINGLVAVKRYGKMYAGLYNAELEPITPQKNAEYIRFFANGSFIIYANRVNYLYNARMECLLQAGFYMKVVDGYFCSVRDTLYDSTDGSVIDENHKPIHTADGKLVIDNNGLYTEDGRQILAYCPARPQVFAGHFLHVVVNGRDLVFDIRMSAAEMRRVLIETVFDCDSENDISDEMFQYFQLIETCLSGRYNLRQKMLKSFFSD